MLGSSNDRIPPVRTAVHLLAILRYEFRRQYRPLPQLLSMGLQTCAFAAIFVWMRASLIGDPLDSVLFAHVWLMLLASPIFAARARFPRHSLVPTRISSLILTKWMAGCSCILTFWLISFPCLSVGAWAMEMPLVWLLKAHLLSLVLLAFGSALGLLCGFVCKRARHAVQLSYLVLALILTAIFWLPPLILQNLSVWIPVLLHGNPFVTLAAILRLDLLRTPYLYERSLISSYSYVYPDWYWSILWWSLGTVLCLAMSIWRLHVTGRDA